MVWITSQGNPSASESRKASWNLDVYESENELINQGGRILKVSTSFLFVGSVVLRGMIFVMTPPKVSNPSERGETSKSTILPTSPESTPACHHKKRNKSSINIWNKLFKCHHSNQAQWIFFNIPEKTYFEIITISSIVKAPELRLQGQQLHRDLQWRSDFSLSSVWLVAEHLEFE